MGTELDVNRQRLQTIIVGFDKDSTLFQSKDLHKLYISLSTTFKELDRVDTIAEIIYGLSEDSYFKLRDFLGLTDTEDAEDYFVGLEEAIEVENIRGVNGEEVDKNFTKKFKEHLRLCCFQREFMTRVSRQATEISLEARKTSEIANKAAKNAEKTKNKIYSEFISILGIFTAISFLTMGSIQLLGTIFNDVSHPNNKKLGYIMEAGGIYLLILSLLIFVMFVGMKKVLGDEGKLWVILCLILVVVSVISLMVFGIHLVG